jgi:hypothetical protein
MLSKRHLLVGGSMGSFHLITLSLVLYSSAFAGNNGNTEISTVLQRPGHVTFLKDEFVPSHLSDGTPTYYEHVVYDGELHRVGSAYDPNEPAPRQHKLSCLGGYSTAPVDSHQQLIPTDVNIKPGTTYLWNILEGANVPRYSYEVLPGDRYVEHFNLYFYNTNTLAELSCSAGYDNPAQRTTVADFEEATGGRMTLGNDRP